MWMKNLFKYIHRGIRHEPKGGLWFKRKWESDENKEEQRWVEEEKELKLRERRETSIFIIKAVNTGFIGMGFYTLTNNTNFQLRKFTHQVEDKEILSWFLL